MTAPADYSVPTKGLSIDLCFFLPFFPFIVDNCNCGSFFKKGYKNEDFFTFYIQ